MLDVAEISDGKKDLHIARQLYIIQKVCFIACSMLSEEEIAVMKKDYIRKNLDILLFLLGMVPLSWMLLEKCRYGFTNIDESFYLTIPYRLCQGDRLLLNEWHLSQLSGWILRFPMAAFLRINGGTEGICLSFRYLYVAAHLGISLLLFFLLRKKSGIGAAAAVLIFYVYAPFGIGALSYNSMGIDCLAAATVILVLASMWWSDAISGFFFAMAVLCCPYLSILYVAYGVFSWGCRKKKNMPTFVMPKRFLSFSLGIVLPAICVLAEILTHIHPDQCGIILKGMLSDPEHGSSLAYKGRELLSILRTHRSFIAFAGLTAAGMYVKKPIVRRLLDFAVLVLTIRSIYACRDYINFLMFPLDLTGLYFYAVYRRESVKDIFWGMWLPGAVYGLCIHLSSNQGFYAISSAMTVSMVASVAITVVTLKELCGETRPVLVKYVFPCLLVAAIVLLGTLEISLRWNFVFWDQDVSRQTQLLREGTHKGLVVTPEREWEYLSWTDAMTHVEDESSLLVLGPETYLYLFGSRTNSSYSAWIGENEEAALFRLQLYYQLNPNKWPDQVVAEEGWPESIGYFEKCGYVETYQAANGIRILEKP